MSVLDGRDETQQRQTGQLRGKEVNPERARPQKKRDEQEGRPAIHLRGCQSSTLWLTVVAEIEYKFEGFQRDDWRARKLRERFTSGSIINAARDVRASCLTLVVFLGIHSRELRAGSLHRSMVCIRQGTFNDLLAIQNINALCLPENYKLEFYINHILSWPQLLHVAEDCSNRKIVGYVLGSLDEELSYCHGQIASLAVLRTHRNLGCATRLMRAAEQAMQDVYGAGSVSLHVREINNAAFCLYSKTLGYKVKIFEKAYYRDGADAFEMLKLFAEEQQVISPTVEPPLLAQEAYG